MDTFFMFFDIMGFKNFIMDNNAEHIEKHFNNFIHGIQTCVSGFNTSYSLANVPVPDLENSNINCLHVSDSVIFWTNSTTQEDLRKLIEVCHNFYTVSMQHYFPLRGCLVHGEINFNPTTLVNRNKGSYFNFSAYGKAFIKSYQNSDKLGYAGCFIDESAIDYFQNKEIWSQLEKYIVHIDIPFKQEEGFCYIDKYAFRLFQKSDFTDIEPVKSVIRVAFTKHLNGNELGAKATSYLNNTVDFIDKVKSK